MDVDIAKRLADRRRAAGLTQEELAEKLGVSRQAVSKWECSESSPDTDNLISLARLYDVSLDDLLYTDVERGGTGTACGEDAEEDAGGEPATDADAGEDDADGAGDARALAGLEQHHEDQEQGGDDLSDRQNCSNNCHFSKSPFSTAPNQAG